MASRWWLGIVIHPSKLTVWSFPTVSVFTQSRFPTPTPIPTPHALVHLVVADLANVPCRQIQTSRTADHGPRTTDLGSRPSPLPLPSTTATATATATRRANACIVSAFHNFLPDAEDPPQATSILFADVKSPAHEFLCVDTVSRPPSL
ncbi:hypothetical protein E4U42_005840 [Claviceps africana]|uniref:Uncharacterized protein n=1 Tax=Claviceps africana TaxID=83212 RepID=A0A8K0J373_9HYPO|nr:hypothetical protein E4U42_005840 [Claviceps africana]